MRLLERLLCFVTRARKIRSLYSLFSAFALRAQKIGGRPANKRADKTLTAAKSGRTLAHTNEYTRERARAHWWTTVAFRICKMSHEVPVSGTRGAMVWVNY